MRKWFDRLAASWGNGDERLQSPVRYSVRRMTLVCTLAAAACSGDVVAPRASLSTDRALRYEAYTDQFRLLLVGSLELVVHEDSTVSGSWTIGWAPGVDPTTPVGPQVGSGALQGR